MNRALVVDDKEENRYYLQALLVGHGYHVDVARHGAEALVLARQARPDVVVSDLLMPVMDGYTLLRQWRADPGLRSVPFIVYTATYTEAEDERLAMDLGADAFILKPAEPDDFLVQLQQVESRAAAARPASTDPVAPDADDPALLKSYSEALIRKLEEKTLQLERTNQVLLADIAERERVQAALEASEAENRLLIESIPQLVWIATPDGVNVSFNQRWRDYTGLTMQESLDDAWDLSIHPDQRPTSRRRWDEAMETGTTFEMEFRLRAADGAYRWMLGRAVPLCDDAGEITKWLGTCTDIEDLRRMEAQFLRAQRLESIGTLASGIAHDLNNVLAPIVTGAGLLDRPDLDASTKSIVDTIVTSAQRGADLIRQVLAYARGVDGERVRVDVGHVVRDVVAMLAPTLPKDVRIEVDADGSWELVGDPTQLHQVVLNLCVNARDAVGSSGTIRVGVHDAPAPAADRHGPDRSRGGRHVAIVVADDGVGIEPEMLDRIFDPFVTTKPTGSGTGLGLATVASIATGHGGTVDVRSTPGHGSEFEVVLPVSGDPDHVQRPAPAAGATGSAGGLGERVLLVDDERAIVDTTSRVLEAAGFTVTASDRSADVLAALADPARLPCDVVVTDVLMPDVDGFALASAVRARWPATPVVVMTGTGDPGASFQDLPGPAIIVLPKPFTSTELCAAVRNALDA